MRVKISETIEVSDEQRVAIARWIDKGEGKKRDATRDEMKDFLWRNGSDWATLLRMADEAVASGTPISEPDDPDQPSLDDLL